jgi:hypothetical protein
MGPDQSPHQGWRETHGFRFEATSGGWWTVFERKGSAFVRVGEILISQTRNPSGPYLETAWRNHWRQP